jgi:uncharacterized membrane protein
MARRRRRAKRNPVRHHQPNLTISNTAVGAGLGALVGAFFGLPGAIIGAGVGAAVGSKK